MKLRALALALVACGGSSPSPHASGPPAAGAPASEPASGSFACKAGTLSVTLIGQAPAARPTPFFLTDDRGVVGGVACNGDDVAITHYRLEPAGAGGKQELECAGGTRLLLSTETGAGSCSRSVDAAGALVGGSCRDDQGNLAEAICLLEDGQGACSRTEKQGACRVSSAAARG